MKTAIQPVYDLLLNSLRNSTARSDSFRWEAASYAFFLILIAATFVL
jgi:hypothetical protein